MDNSLILNTIYAPFCIIIMTLGMILNVIFYDIGDGSHCHILYVIRDVIIYYDF